MFNESILLPPHNDSIEENTLEHVIENLGLEENVKIRSLFRERRYGASHPQE